MLNIYYAAKSTDKKVILQLTMKHVNNIHLAQNLKYLQNRIKYHFFRCNHLGNPSIIVHNCFMFSIHYNINTLCITYLPTCTIQQCAKFKIFSKWLFKTWVYDNQLASFKLLPKHPLHPK
jgi:hypothetical protein